MAKPKFTPAEKRLEGILMKVRQKKLWEEAGEIGKPRRSVNGAEARDLLKAIQKELGNLESMEKVAREPLAVSKRKITKYFEDPSKLSHEDWEKVKKIHGDIIRVRNQLLFLMDENMEKVMKQLRWKHCYDRINVRRGWIPL